MEVWKMVPLLLAFAHPFPLPSPHVQFLQTFVNHNIMVFHDCPQQNKSYLVTWDGNPPLVLKALYYLWQCNNKITICNIQHPSCMIPIAPWSRLMVFIQKLLAPIIGHEQFLHMFIFFIGIWSPPIEDICISHLYKTIFRTCIVPFVFHSLMFSNRS
jgi:hypothetical protein